MSWRRPRLGLVKASPDLLLGASTSSSLITSLSERSRTPVAPSEAGRWRAWPICPMYVHVAMPSRGATAKATVVPLRPCGSGDARDAGDDLTASIRTARRDAPLDVCPTFPGPGHADSNAPPMT